MRPPLLCLAAGILPVLPALAAGAPPDSDSSYIDPSGTAHVTRVVPVPTSISPQAQAWLAKHVDSGATLSTAENRAHADGWEAQLIGLMQPMYPTRVRYDRIAGVPVKIVAPPVIPDENRAKLLINVHGGGFVADWGSSAETIPLASLTRTEVVSVLYRLAPEHPFPAAVDDTVAVYRELLRTHRPQDMVLYGTSAGAILTGEVAVRLKQLDLPEPAALGIFSGIGDYSRPTDSEALFTLYGLSGPLRPPAGHGRATDPYARGTDPRNPVLSPLFADLHGLPPTLFMSSTRDLLLSGTTMLHRAFLRAGVDARLVVFEALPHAFWNEWYLPESIEAHHLMARFFAQRLGERPPADPPSAPP